jgi:hypothetical protein
MAEIRSHWESPRRLAQGSQPHAGLWPKSWASAPRPLPEIMRQARKHLANEASGKRCKHPLYHAPGACVRNEPETDGPIDPLQNFAGDPENHLSCQLSPDTNTEVLQNIEGGGTGETGKRQRPDLIASDIVASQVSNGSDHADLDVQHAGEVRGDGNRQGQYAADTCDKPCGACLGDLPRDEAIYGIVRAAMLRAVALRQIFHTVDAWDPF